MQSNEPGVAPADSAGRRPRRDKRRERNRRNLVDAALELVAEGGPGALTAARIARAAGMDPSGFYAHFKNVEACEREAAQDLERYLRSHFAPYALVNKIQDDESGRAAYAALYRSWLAEPRWCKLMLRTRHHEASPIGRRMHAIVDDVRRDVCELLWKLVMSLRLRTWTRADVELLADLCVGQFMTAFEALVEGRLTDVDAAALAVTRANRVIVVAEIERRAKEARPPSA
jgi:AcrR family transcriptional regulator